LIFMQQLTQHNLCGVILVILSLLFSSCTSSDSDKSYLSLSNGKPNIVIIVLDTARQDRFSCYDYFRETTPNLNELITTARMYEKAYSVSSWTAPAHASMFTGYYPMFHGCTQEHWKLNEGLTTLAEVLSNNGYSTVAIIENPIVSRTNRFDQGFSNFFETWKMKLPVQKRGEDISLVLFKNQLAQRDGD